MTDRQMRYLGQVILGAATLLCNALTVPEHGANWRLTMKDVKATAKELWEDSE